MPNRRHAWSADALGRLTFAPRPASVLAAQGDTLYDLAQEYGLTLEDVEALNPKAAADPKKIAVGACGGRRRTLWCGRAVLRPCCGCCAALRRHGG